MLNLPYKSIWKNVQCLYGDTLCIYERNLCIFKCIVQMFSQLIRSLDGFAHHWLSSFIGMDGKGP